jgi:hypothetical protein
VFCNWVGCAMQHRHRRDSRIPGRSNSRHSPVDLPGHVSSPLLALSPAA